MEQIYTNTLQPGGIPTNKHTHTHVIIIIIDYMQTCKTRSIYYWEREREREIGSQRWIIEMFVCESSDVPL